MRIVGSDRWGLFFIVAVILEGLLGYFGYIPGISPEQAIIILVNLFIFGGIAFNVGTEAAHEEFHLQGFGQTGLVCDQCGPVKLTQIGKYWICDKCLIEVQSPNCPECGKEVSMNKAARVEHMAKEHDMVPAEEINTPQGKGSA